MPLQQHARTGRLGERNEFAEERPRKQAWRTEHIVEFRRDDALGRARMCRDQRAKLRGAYADLIGERDDRGIADDGQCSDAAGDGPAHACLPARIEHALDSEISDTGFDRIAIAAPCAVP